MGTYQNLFNQVLATGVAGVALGQHTAAARDQAAESSARTMKELGKEKNELTKEKRSLEVEADQAALSAADKISDLEKQDDALFQKFFEGKIKINTLKKGMDKNFEAKAQAFSSYNQFVESKREQIEGFNERVELLNKTVDISGKKYKKIFGEMEPIKPMEKMKEVELADTLNKQRLMKMTPEERESFAKLQKIKGGKK